MEIIKVRNKHNRITMLNNATIFVVSYWLVFYIYQLFTLIPAFALQISTIFYTGKIDFDTLTSTASADIWHDADNIFAVFGTSPFIMLFFILFNVLTLTAIEHKSNYSLRMLYYWNIFNGIIRIFGNFIFGHIFYLWSSNLITDFLELSYPSKIGVLICVLVAFILLFFCIMSSLRLVKYIFNPLLGAVKEKALYYILFPVLIGVGFLLIFFQIPYFDNANEWGIFVLASASAYLIYFFTKHKYRDIVEKRESLYIKLNKPLLICVGLSPLIRIAIDRGVIINATNYKQHLIEIFLLIAFLLIFFVLIVGISYYFYKKHKQSKETMLKAQQTFRENNEDIVSEFWGIKTHDMDKYTDIL